MLAAAADRQFVRFPVNVKVTIRRPAPAARPATDANPGPARTDDTNSGALEGWKQ
jgi:hypothetical protein